MKAYPISRPPGSEAKTKELNWAMDHAEQELR